MNNKKKILILTSDAGYGHRSAANAIAAALEELHGESCEIIISNPLEDKRTSFILRDSQTDYDKIVRSAPELYKLGYQASDATIPSTLVESALIVMLYEIMHDILKYRNPDAIITTYPLYQAPLDAVFTLGRRDVPLLTVVTDLATVHRVWFNDGVDYCLVPTETVRELALSAGLTPQDVVITGIPVHPDLIREKRTKNEIRTELGWQPDLITVLAVGSQRLENMVETLNVLNHSGMPLQFIAVAGGDQETYTKLQETTWHRPAHIYNFVDNIPAMMNAADLIICKAGGLIVTESLAVGLPLLLINAIPGQEEGNAEYVVQGGAGALVKNPIEALETVYHWLDKDALLLKKCAESACKLGRPRAAYEIAELAWQCALQNPENHPARQSQQKVTLKDLLSKNAVPLREHKNINALRRKRLRKGSL